jgi:hypothetical protein
MERVIYGDIKTDIVPLTTTGMYNFFTHYGGPIALRANSVRCQLLRETLEVLSGKINALYFVKRNILIGFEERLFRIRKFAFGAHILCGVQSKSVINTS